MTRAPRSTVSGVRAFRLVDHAAGSDYVITATISNHTATAPAPGRVQNLVDQLTARAQRN